MSDRKGMDGDAPCSQGATGKKPLQLHFLLFLPCQLSWQSCPWGALHRFLTMKQVNKDSVLKLFTIISLPLPGTGQEGFSRVALLAHRWTRGVVITGVLLQWFSWSQKMTSAHSLVLSNGKLWDVTCYVTAWQTVTFETAVSSALFFVFTRCVRKCSTPKNK